MRPTPTWSIFMLLTKSTPVRSTLGQMSYWLLVYLAWMIKAYHTCTLKCVHGSFFYQLFTIHIVKYNQAVWRKVQSIGLAEEYKLTLKQFVQKIAAVALCTPFQ